MNGLLPLCMLLLADSDPHRIFSQDILKRMTLFCKAAVEVYHIKI